MGRWLRLPIRTALLAMLLTVCTLPMLAYWYWTYSKTLDDEYEKASARQLLIARNLKAELTNYHQTIVSTFAAFSESFIDGGDPKLFAPLLERLNVRVVCLYDLETGRAERSALGKVSCEAATPSNRLERYGLMTDGDAGVLVTGVELAAGLGPHFCLLYRRGNKIVVGWASTETFISLAKRSAFTELGHAVIVDQTGRVLSHPDAEWRADARDLTSIAPVRRLLAGEEGAMVFFSPALRSLMVAGYTSAPGIGWGAMTPQPLREIEAGAKSLFDWALYSIAAGVALSILISLIAANLIARPTARVAKAARALADGDRDVRLSARDERQTLTELADLSGAFNQMAEQIERSESEEKRLRVDAEKATEAKSIFLANVSHEIRTPMNGILGIAELLRQTELNEKQRDLLARISESGKGLTRLLNDVLDSSRIEAGHLDIRNEPVDLRELVESVVALSKASIGDKRLALQVDFPAEIDRQIYSDGDRLRQVLANLVSNAVRFTPVGTVTIAVEQTSAKPADGARVYKISVIDTGPGVPEKIKSSIFETFVRALRDDHTTISGAGLGLAISKALVEAMGGRIGLDDTPGGGATFWFTVMDHGVDVGRAARSRQPTG